MKFIKFAALLVCASSLLLAGCKSTSCCMDEGATMASCGMACCADGKTDCAGCPQCSAK
jgi:hypothetical protein